MQKKTESLDRILLEKGIITPEQLTQAIQYQCRLPSGQEMSLDQVLIALEYVTEAQVQEALGKRPPAEDVLVQMLMKEGVIQENQLQEAVNARESGKMDKRLGTMLLEMGYASREVIESALKHYYKQHHKTTEMPSFQEVSGELEQRRPKVDKSGEDEPEPLGQVLIRKGYINQDELQDAMDYQQRLPRILHKPIGEILVLLGYIDEDMLDEVMSEHESPQQMSVGDILVKMNVIQQWQLSHAMSLRDQPENAGKKLGSLLMELGYARRPELEAALKEYYARQKQRSE